MGDDNRFPRNATGGANEQIQQALGSIKSRRYGSGTLAGAAESACTTIDGVMKTMRNAGAENDNPILIALALVKSNMESALQPGPDEILAVLSRKEIMSLVRTCAAEAAGTLGYASSDADTASHLKRATELHALIAEA